MQGGKKVHFVLSHKQNPALMEQIAQMHGVEYSIGEEKMFELKSQYAFFANPKEAARHLEATTIFLEHGVGTKSNKFYPVIEYMDLYLVEGTYKKERLLELYPQYAHKLKMLGFSKFDTIANVDESAKAKLYEQYHLDPFKKTSLYAPTFFPSSIQKMHDHFPEHFSAYNILIKAHYLTYERKQYHKEQKKLDTWSRFDNCTVVDVSEYSLLPLFVISDVMISDESSAMFEFAALNKPVISNRYFTLRLSYRFMPWKLNKRIDKQKDKHRAILDAAYSYHDTLHFTKEALHNPKKLESLRLAFSKEICGTIDGKVSERIADLLEERDG